MKVKYTAEIVDDSGKVIGIRTSEADGIPSVDSFDLSTREGFLRDFDAMEKAILKARTELDEDVAEEILSSTAKKAGIKQRKENRGRVGAWANLCAVLWGHGIHNAAQRKDSESGIPDLVGQGMYKSELPESHRNVESFLSP